MSERLLKALMQLFAILSDPNGSQEGRRIIVETFLKQQLNQELVTEYLKIFDDFLQIYQKKQSSSNKRNKAIALSSVKVLTICNVINQELTHKQKIIVLIRLMEFIFSDLEVTEQENEFITTVSDSFYIEKEEFEALKQFIFKSPEEVEDKSRILIINAKKIEKNAAIKTLQSEGISTDVFVFHIKSANMHIFKFFEDYELYLNGQILAPNKIHVLSHGTSIRNSKIKPIYYNDIISSYNIDKIKSKVVFEVSNIEYKFKNNALGLRAMSFTEKSGKLVGIMGVSGAGKSTLLNVLNGNYRPSSGEVLINGVDIHRNPELIEGVIGYVSQDDLLIEDLTVFENLYFNAKLCFDNYNRFRLYRVVLKLLKNLGLYEIKDMKVGSPLNKKISGGQRKRLNIALELIREPSVLFLDEPTSGLSSRDSDNILDLLKELTIRGKLVFVVIHQPSSEIFKMFDNLLILDAGGYLIYYGDPVESIIYYKSKIRQANWSESVCSQCGNVNPEQIFNIIESRVIDEYGNPTQTRKFAPKEWKEKYEDNIRQEKLKRKTLLVKKIPEITFKIPNRFKQFRIFVARDLLAKLSNLQYITINLLEAPVLAVILSFIIKYYNIGTENSGEYNLYENENLPIYIFMSVIIALFVGLSVSAQEIIKDRTILKREAFLNLSRASYLMSKVAILFGLSAFQAFTFVMLGNTILKIPDSYFAYWLILFSTWCFANMLGLNISDGFKTTVTIYILIPFLIIPQIILSGVMVNYDKLNPDVSSPSSIPIYGEVITARWAYEALTVYQFRDNQYEMPLYNLEKQMSEATYRKFWITTLLNNVDEYKKWLQNPELIDNKEKINIVINEFERTKENNELPIYFATDSLKVDKISTKMLDSLSDYFSLLRIYYTKYYKNANDKKEIYLTQQNENDSTKAKFMQTKLNSFNEKLAAFVKKSDDFTKIIEHDGYIYRKLEPIYFDAENFLIKAHFYAPRKRLFGYLVDTYWVNLIVIWLQTLILYITLYFSSLRKVLEFGEYISKNVKKDNAHKQNKIPLFQKFIFKKFIKLFR